MPYFSATIRGGRYGRWGTNWHAESPDLVTAWAEIEAQLDASDVRVGLDGSVAVIEKVEPVVTYPVPFLIGDGTGEVMLDVTYIAEYPRGYDGTCAFCRGDPCAEHSDATTPIGAYFARNRLFAETCPLCDGRPT